MQAQIGSPARLTAAEEAKGVPTPRPRRSPAGVARTGDGGYLGRPPPALPFAYDAAALLVLALHSGHGEAWGWHNSLGPAEERALAELTPTDDWYPPSIFLQGMKFILLGDPSLPLP